MYLWGLVRRNSLLNSSFKLDMIFWFKNFPLGYKVAFTVLTDMQLSIVLVSSFSQKLCCIASFMGWFLSNKESHTAPDEWLLDASLLLRIKLALSWHHSVVVKCLGPGAWQPDFQFLLSKVKHLLSLLLLVILSFLLYKVIDGMKWNEMKWIKLWAHETSWYCHYCEPQTISILKS